MSSDVSVSGGGSNNSAILSGAIKWTGIGSGSDFGSVVDKLVALERRTIDRQNAWKKQWQDKITSITALDTRLVALKLSTETLDSRSELLTRKAVSSDSSVATITNTSTAPQGSYQVEVGKDIREKISSKSFHPAATVGGNPGDKLKISVGGITLEMTEMGAAADPSSNDGYDAAWTVDQMAAAIGARAAAAGLKVDVKVIDDKVRSEPDSSTPPVYQNITYKKLVITAKEGGSHNRITIEDPTDLALDKNSIDAPMKTTWFGASAEPKIAAGSEYLGHTNKTFTFVADKFGTLGQDTITFNWADTEGKKGSFTITAADWNKAVGDSVEPVFEIAQGLKISFDLPTGGSVVKGASFSIECHNPIMQKGQDIGLAQTDKVVHEGFKDVISPIHNGGSGEFRYSYAGKEFTVAVRDGGSLSYLVEQINNDPKNPGVVASIINDGMGTATSYRLALTGSHTGTEHSIRILEPSDPSKKLNVINFDPSKFTWAREASNSMCRIDGFPNGDGEWLQRSTNDVSDVLDGVVLTLAGVGKTLVTVRNDIDGMVEKISQIIDSVNFVKQHIKDETKWGGGKLVSEVLKDGTFVRKEEKPSGLMIGNYGFQIAQTKLDNIMLSPLVRLDKNSDFKTFEEREEFLKNNNISFNHLSEIGVTSDHENKGLYKLDKGKLAEKLKQDPESVIRLFVTDEGTHTKGVAAALAETAAALTRDTDIYGTEQTGNAGQLVQKAKGITKVLIENYNKIIKDIDDKIAREERRVGLVRDRLEQKFARLEKSLGVLNGQSERVAAAIKKLPGESK